MDSILREMPRVYEPRDDDDSRDRPRQGHMPPPTTLALSGTALAGESEQAALLLLYLQELDILESGLILDDAKKEPVFKLLSAALIGSNKSPFHQRPTVDVVVDVVAAMGSAATSDADATVEAKRELADVLTAMLADFPGIPGQFNVYLSIPSPTTRPDAMTGHEPAKEAWHRLVHASNRDYGLPFGSLHWFRVNIAGTNATVAEMLHLLFKKAGFQAVGSLNEVYAVSPGRGQPGVAAPGAATPATASTVESANAIARGMDREQVDKIEQFLSKLLSRTQALGTVKQANLKMAVVRGYEQFGLLITFWWMAFLLAARFARRRKEEKRADNVIKATRKALESKPTGAVPNLRPVLDVILTGSALSSSRSITRLLVQTCHTQLGQRKKKDKTSLEETARHIRGNDAASRWIIVWLSRTLPALGFLGTVHGIALALMGADALVRAVTPEGQAAAVNAVASNLGIAFTTTFIALVMGIVLSWLNDRQSYQERLLVTELERELGYVLDPIGFDPTVAPPAPGKVARHGP